MPVPEELLRVLLCPVTNKELLYDSQTETLKTEDGLHEYPIKDGIPILLADNCIESEEILQNVN